MVLLHGTHSSDGSEDRTPNPGLVDAEERVPWWLRFRPPVRVAAGMCGCCGGLVDTAGHCACSL